MFQDRICCWTVTIPSSEKERFEQFVYRGASRWAKLDCHSKDELCRTYSVTAVDDDEAEVGMDFYLYVKRTIQAGQNGVKMIGSFSEHKGDKGQEVHATEFIGNGAEFLSIRCPDEFEAGIVFLEDELVLRDGAPVLTEEAAARYQHFFRERERIIKLCHLPSIGWNTPLIFQGGGDCSP